MCYALLLLGIHRVGELLEELTLCGARLLERSLRERERVRVARALLGVAHLLRAALTRLIAQLARQRFNFGLQQPGSLRRELRLELLCAPLADPPVGCRVRPAMARRTRLQLA